MYENSYQENYAMLWFHASKIKSQTFKTAFTNANLKPLYAPTDSMKKKGNNP